MAGNLGAVVAGRRTQLEAGVAGNAGITQPVAPSLLEAACVAGNQWHVVTHSVPQLEAAYRRVTGRQQVGDGLN